MSWLEDLRAEPPRAGGEGATDEEVEQFAAEHAANEQPWHLAEYIVPMVRNANGSTRNAAFKALHEAARDARVGWCSWAVAMAEIEAAARDSYAERGEQFGEKDFARSAKYAVAEANAEDMPDLEARYAKRLAQEQRLREMVENWAPVIGEPARGSRFGLVSARELAQPVPPMRWLVRGMWTELSAGVLGGEKKTLKTWTLQAMGIVVAAGMSLFDKYHAPSPGGVLYLCGEGGRDLFANRHQVIAERFGIADALPDLPFGAEFGVGMLTDNEFIDAVKRHLNTLQPKLVILDPLYAYHPNDVEVQNVYARGPMLANLRALIGGEAALIVGDHFNKTAPGRLDLDNIAQAGMSQWADSWILQKHRETPNLEDGKFLLEIETGTRRGSGKHLEVDWTLGRDESDPDVLGWVSVDWEARSFEAKAVEGESSRVAQRIMQVVRDNEFELTESGVVKEVGGKREKAFEVLDQLKVNGWIVVENCERQEGTRMVKRNRVGVGETAKRLGGAGTSSEVVPDEGTGSEPVEP